MRLSLIALAATTIILSSCSSSIDPALTAQKIAEPYEPIPGVPLYPQRKQTSVSYSSTKSRSYSTTSYRYYKVRSGDTLWKVGQKTGVNWKTIQRANGLTNSNIWVGQTLKIPR